MDFRLRKISTFIFLLALSLTAGAVDWTTVVSSGDYYYGEGEGETMEAASQSALNRLLESIVMNVSSDFTKVYDGVTTPKGTDFRKTVRQCMETYSSSSLNNVEMMQKKQRNGRFLVLRFMLKSELEKIYQSRIDNLKQMVGLAEQALDRGDVSVALQYYYWSYALLRSLQYPNSVKDDDGNILVVVIPMKIRDILDDIDVTFVSRDEDFVDLLFTYKGQPTTVDFTYYDGRKDGCEGNAEAGNACIEMAEGFADDGIYHINIEYEYKSQARGEAEMKSVLAVIPKSNFGKEIVVRAPQTEAAPILIPTIVPSIPEGASIANNAAVAVIKTEDRLASVQPKPVAVQPVELKINEASETEKLRQELPLYAAVMDTVVRALATRQYYLAMDCFKEHGLDNFRRLVTKRNGKLIGQPNPRLYVNARGNVVARGMQLSFSVTERGQKTTYVDDVIFTFDDDRKISNVTFGIGSIAENDLLEKNVTWGEDVRQQVMDFLENYKTAYCLKDSDYIEAVFDDNATIIVGNVAKVTTHPGMAESEMSEQGRDIITYKQYTKAEYLTNLKKTFRRNQFINVKFTSNDVQLIERPDGGKVFAIQVAQQYNSSTYADFGYLFLLVDMTQPDEPVIKIRTWQPKPDEEFGLWGPGHFYE